MYRRCMLIEGEGKYGFRYIVEGKMGLKGWGGVKEEIVSKEKVSYVKFGRSR